MCFLTVIIQKTINDKIDNIGCTIAYLAAYHLPLSYDYGFLQFLRGFLLYG